MKQLPTAGLISLQGNKLLLAFSRNKQAWYLPGGKTDSGESPQQGLIREIQEELNLTLKAENLTFFAHISAPAYGEEELLMEQDCYITEVQENIQPSAEIEAVKYFSLEEYKKETVQVIGVLMVFEELQKQQLI
ncbi:NUDIX domain-containing protein [Elizabethkingia meningoseptica]|uniref:NUDIX hydrolase n=1 Tax=Elizabethkingia meningoseptica TaxID=238 RepID=UPI0008419F34|nr:NUDIX domain-containing protein [Elizabethkingia meningoseptica]MCL1676168.1 NUDIX domain-containing protein [Elizabethkingia meningoseptica]MCL1684877.1 NUDIX domain-containing protein [Elizabethkingia meningoseptica]MDE5437768.1 NUDIX domain-containing protein [Elizabethkingia meningoseptica]MDE5491243.1 NUDIX domain-containing protein [Elizabethkingia meningoseptica]MDE5507199.1 NUDIX domain-containing protein [Elizabethkingia meningoseptica]